MNDLHEKAPWWQDGLVFSCQRCSVCCRHEPGYVFLSKYDIKQLITHFNLNFRQCADKLLRAVDVGTGFAISLKEKDNYDCILWENGGCLAYEARPIQCSTYPFWASVMSSSEAWKNESVSCPGIGKGNLVAGNAIQDALLQRRQYPAIIMSYGFSLETIDEDSLLGR